MKIHNKMVEFVFSMILRALLVSLLVGFVAVAISQAGQARERISSKQYQSFNAKEAVLNAAFGAEYYPRDDIALRTGLFTDLANTPSLSSSDKNQAEHVDNYGISLSLTFFNQSSNISLGASYALGTGEAQVVADSYVIQDVETNTFALILAASYAF